VFTDVLEEHVAGIFNVEEISKPSLILLQLIRMSDIFITIFISATLSLSFPFFCKKNSKAIPVTDRGGL
jgi:hypothetical protein